MADYRQFCNSCGNETGWGSHKPDCESANRVAAAEAQRRDWERAMFNALAEYTDEQIVQAMVEFELRARALGQEMAAIEKNIMALKEASRLRDWKILDKVREELKDRG